MGSPLMSAIFPGEDASPAGDDVVQLRKPPHSEEAEQSLLGALLIDNSALAKVSETIKAGDFFLHAHREVFKAITTLAAAGSPADVVTVFDELGDKAGDAGGLGYLNQLAQCVPSASNIQRYAEIVSERATLRQIVALADVATSRALRNESAAQVLEDARTALTRLQDQRGLQTNRLPLLKPSQLREHALSLRWLVKGFIPADSVGMIFGASQAFKSFLAMDMACHVAHGLPWLGKRTTQGPVVYIAAEGGGGAWSRLEAWHKARKLDFSDDVPIIVLPLAVDLRADAWRVVEAVEALGVDPALVVVDTVSQTYSGEENSASDMAAYLREIGNRIRARWHCVTALLHHTGHLATERPRGSSVITSNLDWLHGVFRDEKEMLATLISVKQKDAEPFTDQTFALTVHTIGTDEDGDRVTSLVAKHLTSAEDLQDAMEHESKAGRGGHHTLFLNLVQHGCEEADVRKAFYDQCGLSDADSRKRTYNRVKAWAVKQGFVDIAEGRVFTLKGGTQNG